MNLSNRRVRRLCLAAIVVAAISEQAFIRAQTASEPRFDAATIKPIPSAQGQFHGGSCHGVDSQYRPDISTSPPPLGRCVFPNTVLGNILEYAYSAPGKPRFPISGGDKWVGSETFELQATAGDPSGVTEQQLILMLRTFLREQSKLQFHWETHEEQGFALVQAGNGRSLKVPNGNETRPGVVFAHQEGSELVISGDEIPVQALINFLSGNLRQTIQDETKLGNVYDVVLRFTPSAGETTNTLNSDGTVAAAPGPSLFTALQDQLGLRLVSQKVTVETFVIDHVEHP
jgi:uncharacterized protein (TIGR03435 family)